MAPSLRKRRHRPRAANNPSDDNSHSEPSVTSTKRVLESPSLFLARSWLRRYRNESCWTPNLFTACILLFSVRILGATVNGIADCDETYNYWEPLHMLLHGSGLQTWEYSPDFALRSYAFLLPYASVARFGFMLVRHFFKGLASAYGERLIQFYSVRVGQALLCAVAELSLYDACVFRFGPHVARVFLGLLVASPGMFRACTELLPSSFAMIMFMFAASNWFMGRFRVAVVFVAIGAELGWPFAALLGLPMALHIIVRRGVSMLLGVASSIGTLIFMFMVPIDSFYFGRLVVAPLNIVWYNVFPVPGAGPELFGTEPFSFYLANLCLNCNVAFLALASYPVLWVLDILGWSAAKHSDHGKTHFRMTRAIFLTPCFLWLGVFCIQAHKEERFLAPVYPLIALVGAVSVCDWCLLLLGPPTKRVKSNSDAWSTRSPQFVFLCRNVFRLSIVPLFMAGAVALGASRIVMQVKNFGAPFHAFTSLSKDELRGGLGPRNAPTEFLNSASNINICIGKEWFRFPSHFFLPDKRFHLRFVKSGFKGLLPKPFDEGGDGTRSAPAGMNMFNIEDPAQYVKHPGSECHYLVDLDLGSRQDRRSGYVTDSSGAGSEISETHRLVVFSAKMVDLDRSPAGYRAFWVPGETDRRVYYGMFKIYRNIGLVPLVP